MHNYLINIVRIVFLFFSASRNMKRQKSFVKKHLIPIVENAKQNNDGTLNNEDFRRINTYAVTIPAMLGEAFCQLRGRQMSDNERLAITFLGSITGLFDDLFDSKNLSPDYIKNLLNKPEESNALNSNERLIIELYRLGLTYSDKSELIRKYALNVYEAQLQSQKQCGPKLHKETIKQITFNKGGVSIPLYRCAFDDAITDAEYDLLYSLGAIGQLENDIFDVYKDYSEHIQTMATTETNISNLKNQYHLLMNDIFQLIDNTHYLECRKRKFRYFVALIVGRGLVGLNQLHKLSRKTEGRFLPEKYSRKELICDMEQPPNLLRLIHYAAIYAKK